MPNVNVTYDEMRRAGAQLRQGKENLIQQLNDLRVMIQGLVDSGFVTDQASIAFNETYGKFTEGSTTTVSALEGLAQFLDSAANAMQETDSQLANSIRHS